MGKKNKITTVKHTFLDVEGSTIPESFINKLRDTELFTYRDTVMKEHLYDIDNVLEHVQENPEFLESNEEKRAFDKLYQIMVKAKATYFRFVFN